MSLLVVAFPIISAKDFAWIQSYRKVNDVLYYDVIAPHFTLVFPVFNKAAGEFIQEIEKQSTQIPAIEFEIDTAMLNKDAFKDSYHEFLVPGKGYNEIIALHDKLYSGSLITELRTDIEYIPHIGIGNSTEMNKCRQAVADLNSKQIFIAGSIATLTIIEYLDNKVTTLKEIFLG